MKPLATALSILLHPLWMPTFTLALCTWVDPYIVYGFTKDGLLIVFAMVFIMTGLFPLCSALLMRRTGVVSDITMPRRSERLPAYVTTLIYYAMCYYLLRRTSGHAVLLGIFQGAVIATVLSLLITLWWKISAHMVGIGGLVGALIAVMLVDGRDAPVVLCAAFILTGALGTARLLTSDHTLAQILAGTVLGGACVFLNAWSGVVI